MQAKANQGPPNEGPDPEALESQISQKLVEATDWKLRVNGHRSGPIATGFPNHLPEGILRPLRRSSGESAVLGPWANCVDQDKTSCEKLSDLVLLYLGAAIKWLETEHVTDFATKTEVDPVKLLSIPDLVNATGTVQRSAGRGAKMPTYRIPHREGSKQRFGDTAADALRPRW
jgi:hypothetical protein